MGKNSGIFQDLSRKSRFPTVFAALRTVFRAFRSRPTENSGPAGLFGEIHHQEFSVQDFGTV